MVTESGSTSELSEISFAWDAGRDDTCREAAAEDSHERTPVREDVGVSQRDGILSRERDTV